MNSRFSKERWTNLILCLATLTMMLGLSEWLLRKTLPAAVPPPQVFPGAWAIIPERSWIQHDPDLGWFHKPNQSSALEKNGRSVPLSTNVDGLRGKKNYTREKIPGQTRIAVFGDSFTSGFGVLTFYPEDFWRALPAFNDGGYGKPYFELTPTFKEAVREKSIDHYYIPEDQHWTPAGHELAAETLLSQIASLSASGKRT